MSKRTLFTKTTPLPPTISRHIAVRFLHNHLEMIDLNPLVVERHPIATPPDASDEERACVWYSLTDKVPYLPGGLASGSVTYRCAFHDMPDGLQTHCYAPLGVEIRGRWTVAGNAPGEAPQPVELGIGAPTSGLYLREDVDMRCNFLMTAFVKATLVKAHQQLVERLKVGASMASAVDERARRAPASWSPAPSHRLGDAGYRSSLPSKPLPEPPVLQDSPPPPPPYTAGLSPSHPPVRRKSPPCSSASGSASSPPPPPQSPSSALARRHADDAAARAGDASYAGREPYRDGRDGLDRPDDAYYPAPLNVPSSSRRRSEAAGDYSDLSGLNPHRGDDPWKPGRAGVEGAQRAPGAQDGRHESATRKGEGGFIAELEG